MHFKGCILCHVFTSELPTKTIVGLFLPRFIQIMRIINLGYRGIHLPDAGVHLDGSGPVPSRGLASHHEKVSDNASVIFISHAHSDHVPRNRKRPVCATPATAALMRDRGHTGPIREIPFGEPVTFPRATVTLYPAGHILGSSMIFVESEQGSLLYTGDCRTPPSPVSEGFELPDRPVDFLIIEATFALPLYKWDTHEVLFRQIRHFAAETLADEATPVILCYNLGKAQEVMHALAASDPPLTVQIHRDGEKLCHVYEQFGLDLGSWEPYNPDTIAGKVLLTPSPSLDSPKFQKLQNRRIAYVSGWASLKTRAAQIHADTLIPLSDHLDFFELLNVCRKLKPRHTWLTHSPNPDVVLHFLQQDGLSCSSLEPEQTSDEGKN